MPNTTASALLTDHVAKQTLTVLQHRLAPLSAFTRDFGTDRLKPLAKVQVPIATSGGTAQTNATDFEDTTNFVATIDNVEVTVARITSGAHLTPAELNSGHRMEQFVELKAGELADKIWDLVGALLIEGNFEVGIQCAPAAFGQDETGTLFEAISKVDKKHLVLGEAFYRRLLPANLQSHDVLAGTLPGWNGVHLATRWSAAGASIRGFAAGPTAIAIASGLPLASPNASSNRREIVLPGIGLVVELSSWYSARYKTDWMNWEVMFGASVGDASALRLVKQV